MDDNKTPISQLGIWPPRPDKERRLYPRLEVAFPVVIHIEDGEEPLKARASDISLGGLRLKSHHHMALFDLLALRIELPQYTADGEIYMEPVDTHVVVVRVEPEEPSDDADEYDVAFAFTQLSDDAERTIGRFILQMLLVDPEALVR